MQHKPIKKYTHSGEIRDDSDFIRIRQQIEKLIIDQMRSEGYLPIYELGIDFSTKWCDKKYSFKLTMYASFAGSKKALLYDFWCNGMLVRDGR